MICLMISGMFRGCSEGDSGCFGAVSGIIFGYLPGNLGHNYMSPSFLFAYVGGYIHIYIYIYGAPPAYLVIDLL